jgi:adenosine/AMP kinase
MMDQMELKSVRLEIPENGNIMVGQSHFIKTVEDIYEAIVNTVPQMKFGVAFNEASGACLIRIDGNDAALKANATRNAQAIAAGHTFVLSMTDGYPINVLGRIRDIPEICTIFCATANPVEVIVAESEQGRGVLGVIDGSSPKGVETESDQEWRHSLLRKIGYKR